MTNYEREMIKAVLFDLDGTLLDRETSIRLFINRQYDRYVNELSLIPKEVYVKRFLELDDHGYVWKDKVYQQLVKEFEMAGLTWEQLLADYINEFKNHCILFPYIIGMLEELRSNHYKLGIITNGKGQFQMDNINALDITKYFDTILISEWEGIKKPNLEIFERASDNLNILLSQSVFIGDHPLNDVKAAQEAGMIGIWKRNDHWNKSNTKYVVDDLLQIPNFIKNLI